jgi:non-heme chloroperoxidase
VVLFLERRDVAADREQHVAEGLQLRGKAFCETDLTEDLAKFDVPTLILHGDDDQIVPIAASAMLSSKLVKGATLKVYAGAPHGMCTTLKDRVNAELLAFLA